MSVEHPRVIMAQFAIFHRPNGMNDSRVKHVKRTIRFEDKWSPDFMLIERPLTMRGVQDVPPEFPVNQIFADAPGVRFFVTGIAMIVTRRAADAVKVVPVVMKQDGVILHVLTRRGVGAING